MLLEATRIELYKIFARPRTYISFGAIIVLVLGIQGAIYADGQKLLDFTTQNLQENFDFSGNLLNGYFTSYIILNTLWVHIPLLVALVVGDLIAGEANMGTTRFIFTRTISRTQLLTAKFISATIYCFLVVLFLCVSSLFSGLILFGDGDLIVLRNTINIFSADDVLWRFIAAFSFGLLAMMVVSSISFLLSAMADNSVGPIIGTMAIILAFTVFSSLDLSIFHYLRPYMFTSYMSDWRNFFDYEIDWNKIYTSITILVFHVVLLFSITLFYYHKKDIQS
jgi:ABC-2 type transport system permease protein